ncbi:pyridoxamine 5'-phosphate oxidase family protein [Haloplanus halophilus]|uniref:pyridoxamine 5'-phosphate oxidase family protein n=1 Tax=Haloplanus halophilus TaxID=2949993 RepID=UPI00203D1C57|nr:pyridoxamine 5'-phosphate oxidase family protein [Haloplanus sp. GDY1]
MTADAMSRAEVDDALRAAGAGVLSLTDGAETYAVPEAFGYDGEHVYFQFVYGADSDKMAFVETTDIATLTVFTERPARSVIVRGRLQPVGDEDADVAMRAIAANADIPTVDVSLDADPDALEFDLYRLVPEERSGRTFGVAPAVDI